MKSIRTRALWLLSPCLIRIKANNSLRRRCCCHDIVSLRMQDQTSPGPTVARAHHARFARPLLPSTGRWTLQHGPTKWACETGLAPSLRTCSVPRDWSPETIPSRIVYLIIRFDQLERFQGKSQHKLTGPCMSTLLGIALHEGERSSRTDICSRQKHLQVGMKTVIFSYRESFSKFIEI
jgi:hypothetical protein